MHTHLFPPAFGDLSRWGIDNLLTYHYLVAEVMRAADVTAGGLPSDAAAGAGRSDLGRAVRPQHAAVGSDAGVIAVHVGARPRSDAAGSARGARVLSRHHRRTAGRSRVRARARLGGRHDERSVRSGRSGALAQRPAGGRTLQGRSANRSAAERLGHRPARAVGCRLSAAAADRRARHRRGATLPRRVDRADGSVLPRGLACRTTSRGRKTARAAS